MDKIAVVTGANRGIGLEIVRQLAREGARVVLTSREAAGGEAARGELERKGLRVLFHPLDVSSDESARALAAWIQKEHGGLDILVNNAGMSMNGFNAEVARRTLDTNFFGALRVTDALLPLMRSGGRIVMLSSGMGQRSKLGPELRARFEGELGREELLALMQRFVDDVAAGRHSAAGWPSSAYSVSKIGLNVLAAVYGRQLDADGRGILCNAVDPGWVRTDMGGSHAPRSIEEGADTPVWLALLPEGGPQGGVFRDRKPAAW